MMLLQILFYNENTDLFIMDNYVGYLYFGLVTGGIVATQYYEVKDRVI